MANSYRAKRRGVVGATLIGLPLTVLLMGGFVVDLLTASRFNRLANDLANLGLLGVGIILGALFGLAIGPMLDAALFFAERKFGFAIFDARGESADESKKIDTDDSDADAPG